MDVIEAISRGAAEYPDKIAHISDDRSLTYKELATKSDALAAHLVQRYPGDKSPVAIIGHKGPEMLIGFLGAVKSGHPYVPIDLSVPVHRANRIVESSGAIAALMPDRITEISNGFSPSARVLLSVQSARQQCGCLSELSNSRCCLERRIGRFRRLHRFF